MRDQVQVAAIMLYEGESEALQPPLPGLPEWVPKSEMPYSADLFLGGSGKIDFGHAAVRKAAREVRRLALGHVGTSPALDDPRITVKAAKAWVENNIQLVSTAEATRRQATRWTSLWPSASEIIEDGESDELGRMRVLCALLRTFQIPARPAWFRGAPAVQYWVQPVDPPLKAKKPKKKKKKAPRGYWMLDRPRYAGEAVDAYSLESGDFEWITWNPAQEMAVRDLGFQQAYYPYSQSMTAKADLEYASKHGELPPSARLRTLPPPPPLKKGEESRFVRLVRVAYELTADGALQQMLPVALLVPYLDHQDWNLEAAPLSPSKLKVLGKGIWTNRPERLIREKGRDYYSQNLPAMGQHHRIALRLRKPHTLLHASIEDGQLKGRMLRADNLAPRPDGAVEVRVSGLKGSLIKLTPDNRGYFSTPLPSDYLDQKWIEVSAGRTDKARSRWDRLLLPMNTTSN